jgi:hypothetical protein
MYKHKNEMNVRKYYIKKSMSAEDKFIEEARTNFRIYKKSVDDVQHDGLALQHVPQSALDYNKYIIYLEAVQQNGLALQYVQHESMQKTCPVCFKPLELTGEHEKTNNGEYLLDYVCLMCCICERYVCVKNEILTLDDFGVHLTGIYVNGYWYIYRNESIMHNVYLKAVQQNGLALQYIPQKFISRKVCDAAVNQNKQAVEFVPPRI